MDPCPHPNGLDLLRYIAAVIEAKHVSAVLYRPRTARVLFFVADAHMVLVHGFLKKTRATPRKDMALALSRKRKWESSI